MKITIFVMSTLLVSTTFGILGYVIISLPIDGSDNTIRMRGISYLALLPYFLGALLNKEGYWHLSKKLDRLQEKKFTKKRTRVLQIIIAFLLVGFVSIAYLYWESHVARTLIILILTAMWIGVIRRAWLVYKTRR